MLSDYVPRTLTTRNHGSPLMTSPYCCLSRASLITLLSALPVALGISTASAQTDSLPPYDLVLVTQRGFALGAERKWLEALQRAGIRSVRVRAGTGRETPKVENTGTQQRPRYAITGVLMRGNRLALPGNNFTLSQTDQLKKWIDRVRRRGTDAAVGKPEAFGLTAGELVKLHELLARPVAPSTQGRPLADVANQISRLIAVPIEWTPGTESALREADPCLDELKGISAGTALAAALRPAGLSFVPKPRGPGRYQLSIVRTRSAKEHWPVGWPPLLRPTQFAPGLMVFATIEARNKPLVPVLRSISQRTNVPYLLDHNSLALAGIEPSKLRVDLPRHRTFYKNHLDRMLRPLKLKAELKMDEAGKPLLWITTSRRP